MECATKHSINRLEARTKIKSVMMKYLTLVLTCSNRTSAFRNSVSVIALWTPSTLRWLFVG